MSRQDVPSSSAPHRVAVLVGEGVNGFELAVVAQVFGDRRAEAEAGRYIFDVCGSIGQSIELAGGMQLGVSHDLTHAIGADTVVVPAWLNRSRTYDPAILEVLREVSERGSRIVSMCTGAFILAAAGLLDGRPATTHWLHASLLQEWYPSIDVKSDLLYVDDGDILTSAGSSAAIDLSLHLVAKDHGSAVAADVARRLVLAPHRQGGQTQFSAKAVSSVGEGDSIGLAMKWAMDHLSEVVRIKDLARLANSSERTFIRQFDAQTGMSPMRWLQYQRVDKAKELLERTALSIPMVAQQAGLGSPANFRNHFLRHVGVSPSRYRDSFRSAAGAATEASGEREETSWVGAEAPTQMSP